MRKRQIRKNGVAAAADDPAPAPTVTVTESTGTSGTNGASAGDGQEPTDAEASVSEPNDPEEGTDVYDVYGNTWGKLPRSEQVAAAGQYIASNPERCPNAGAEDVVSHVNRAYGSDYPLATLASEIMGDTCDLAATGD